MNLWRALIGSACVVVVVKCNVEPDHARTSASLLADVNARASDLYTRYPILNTREPHAVSGKAATDLPNVASGTVTVADVASDVVIAFSLCGTNDANRVDINGMSIYPAALSGADRLQRVGENGTEDFVAFESRPTTEELRYDVDVSRVAGVRSISNVVEFLDASGTPRLRVAPPFVIQANGSRTSATLALEGCAFDTGPAPSWGRPVTKPGTTCVMRVTWRDVVYPALVDPHWQTTGNLIGTKTGGATLLQDGRVLITGGTSQIYDPTTATFGATGAMGTARTDATATLLPTNRVLVAGGDGSTTALASAELFDPTAGTFSATGAMTSPRALHTATLLNTGKVLVVGGMTTDAYAMPALTNATELATAELYDPSTGKFTTTGSMKAARAWHTATLLPDNTVLIAGGFYETSGGSPNFPQTAELYGNGTFTSTGTMAAAHVHHIAIALSPGVLIAGGGYVYEGQEGTSYNYINAAEMYVGGSFVTVGNMLAQRGSAAAATLPSGDAIIIGGGAGNSTEVQYSTTEIFDQNKKTFSQGESLATPCGDPFTAAVTATVLQSHIVLTTCEGGAAFLYTLDNGQPCTKTSACASGFCVDGVCCDTACTGQCQACDVAGDVGTCSAVNSGPSHGARPSCTCDNGQCSNHQCSDPHTSQSTDGGTEDCTPYVCATTGFCSTSCASVTDCVSPNVCDSTGRCVAPPSGSGGCNTSNGATDAWWLIALVVASRRLKRRLD